MTGPLHFAAVGDVHGRQREMVRLVSRGAAARGVDLDFVVQVGDFEGNRDESDRAGRAPEALLGDFPAFIAGSERFPWPLSVIGGNHEPYRHLDTLAPGTALAQRCIWLGWSGVGDVHGLRIAWQSGIHSAKAFPARRPTAAATASWKQSTYFTAEDIARARTFGPIEVLLLHDWPSGLVARGEDPFAARGLAVKPWFVGNKHARELIDTLAPRLVLCGHLHVPYRRELPRAAGGTTLVRCLASVAEGDDACAYFRVKDGMIEEV
ncbi:MAG: metallophosphoesterase family protein [Planctomycetes bacterium]|nr:metallophosphoesterase family protein [Planctomycetota bacterium]